MNTYEQRLLNQIEGWPSAVEMEALAEDLTEETLLLHSLAYMEEGSPGILVDEEKARATPCTCHDSLCTSPGVIGSLSEEQRQEYCPSMIQKGPSKRLAQWREAVEVCKQEIEPIPKGARLQPYLSCMSRRLRERGVEA